MGAMQVNYTPPGTYARITVENMIHIFEPERPGMTRGLPMCTPVERTLHDLDDLQDLEMQKSKENATTAKVVKTKTGEAPSSADMYRNKFLTQSQDANGNAVTKPMPQFYEITQGGEVVYMQPGEDMQEFRSETPSAATQEHWATLIGQACIGIGIPRVLVVPYTIQGTVLRADIETAAAYCRARSAIVAFAMSRLYKWAIGWAVDYDTAFKGVVKPSDWASVVVRPPRGVNVDVGRQSAALINEMNAGIRTLADICNELGLDWREVIKQRAKEAKFINDIAEKMGVPREQVALPPKPPTPPPGEGFAPPANGNGSAHFKINGHAKRLELV
jgi:capsid protein